MSAKVMSMDELVAGLKPALESHPRGMLYQETNVTFASKCAECFRSSLGIMEVDQIVVTPKVSRSYVGADDLIATMYFSVGKGSENVFFRGKGNNRGSSGRVNMVQSAGYGAGGGGMFGTSEKFRQVIGPFCKTDQNGKALMNLKSVPGYSNVASLEIDFMALLCLFLGVSNDDQYDCTVFSVEPVPNTDNVCNMMFVKYIVQGGNKNRGKSGVNYDRIGADQWNRVNGGNRGGGNNNGGRSYN